MIEKKGGEKKIWKECWWKGKIYGTCLTNSEKGQRKERWNIERKGNLSKRQQEERMSDMNIGENLWIWMKKRKKLWKNVKWCK